MARNFSRSQVHRVTRAKRTSQWLFVDIQPAAVPAASKLLLGTLNAVGLSLRPFTIVRTHLEILWNSDQAAATEVQLGALGLMVVNDTAAALGVTGIPSPMSNADADWYTWQGLAGSFDFLSAVGFDAQTGRVFKVDSKAMRKVGADDDVVTMVENTHATTGAQISIMGRFLIKLH